MMDIQRYSQMQKEFYRNLAEQSNYSTGQYTDKNDSEFVVGHYAMHECYDYEGPLLADLGQTEQMLALEYGCGPGRMLARLAPRFLRVDGVDLSAEVLKVAKQYCAKLKNPPLLFNNDGTNLSMIADSTYDLAYSVICLQHICVHSIRKQIMNDIYRVLKPKGIFTFQMGYGTGHQQPTAYGQDFINASGTNGANDVMVLHPWEPIKDLLEIGFRDIRFSIQPICPGDSHSAWIFIQARKTTTSEIIIRNPQKEFTREELDSSYNYFKQIHAKFSIHNTLAALEQNSHEQEEQLKTFQEQIHKEQQRSQVLQAGQDKLLDERLKLQQQLEQLRDLRFQELLQLCRAQKLRLVLFGAGEHTDMLFQQTALRPEDVTAIYDNNPKFWGQEKAKSLIRSPEQLKTDDLDIIIISSKAFAKEIEQQLQPLLSKKTLLVNLYSTGSEIAYQEKDSIASTTR